jgi:hypothetical protein
MKQIIAEAQKTFEESLAWCGGQDVRMINDQIVYSELGASFLQIERPDQDFEVKSKEMRQGIAVSV